MAVAEGIRRPISIDARAFIRSVGLSAVLILSAGCAAPTPTPDSSQSFSPSAPFVPEPRNTPRPVIKDKWGNCTIAGPLSGKDYRDDDCDGFPNFQDPDPDVPEPERGRITTIFPYGCEVAMPPNYRRAEPDADCDSIPNSLEQYNSNPR